MSILLQIVFLLAVILLAAKTAGYLSASLGQPAVLGELGLGILLGPSLLNLLGVPFIAPEMPEFIRLLGELGVLMLMFLAGLEFQAEELVENLRVAVFAGTLGVAGPVLLGWGTGLLFGMSHTAALFLGLTLGATSVSISAQTLIELKSLRTRVGLSLLGAAIFDDILIILLLSVFLAFVGGNGGGGEIAFIVLRMALFIGGSVFFGLRILPWIVRRVSKMPINHGALAVALVTMLAYSFAAEYFGGLAAITGAFLAGLMLARTPEKEKIEAGMHPLAYGFFVPVFFVGIGLSVDLRGFPAQALLFTVVIALTAILGKWLGAGAGAKLGGLSAREAIQLGAGMISRGEVGLIAVSIGLVNHLIGGNEFSAIVVMVLVTTLVTPPLLRWLFASNDARARNIQTEEEPSPLKREAAKWEAS